MRPKILNQITKRISFRIPEMVNRTISGTISLAWQRENALTRFYGKLKYRGKGEGDNTGNETMYNSIEYDVIKNMAFNYYKDEKYNVETCVPEIIIGLDVLEKAKLECKKASPNETMGFLVGYKGYTNEGRILTIVKDMLIGPVKGYRANATVPKEERGHFLMQILEKYPDCCEIGWWHSHPGFGCFLSGTDIRHQKEWYDHPHSIALVIDPIQNIFAFFKLSLNRERYASYLVVNEVNEKFLKAIEIEN